MAISDYYDGLDRIAEDNGAPQYTCVLPKELLS